MAPKILQLKDGGHSAPAAKKQRTPQVENLLGVLEAKYKDALIGLESREWIINENMAFFKGLQWGQATDYGFFHETEESGEAQEVYNYVRPTVRSAVASMLRAMPNPEVVAAHDSQDAMTRAQATQRLIRSLLRDGTVSMDELYRGEVEAQVKGAVWFKVYFDPNAGKVTRGLKFKPQNTASGEPSWELELDASGRPVMVEQFEGAIRLEFRDIVDVLPDPNATKEFEVGWLFDRKLVPEWKLDDQFAVDAYGVSTVGRWSTQTRDHSMQMRDATENMQRGLGVYGRGAQADGNQLCELIEYWERPTRKNPRGRLIVYQGDVIIAMSDLPYDWPWVLRNGQNIVPNSLYADGVVYDLKPLQRTINLNASKKREWMDKLLSPPMLIPREANIARDYISDIAGDLIEYNTGNRPEWMTVPSIPSAMFELESSLVSIMKDVSTYSDISRGDAPAGIETGRALAYLHEFQQGVREPDTILFQWSIVQILRKCLQLVRDFYHENRLIKMIGENNRWMLAPFKRADYDFDAEIDMEVESSVPNSKALRLAQMSELFQIGAFSDTPEAQRFRKLAGIDFTDHSTVDDAEPHRRRAREQIAAIKADPTYPLVALEQENHEVFLEVLDHFRVCPEYFNLSPMARMAVDDYVAQHEQWLQMQIQNFAMQEAMLGGGGKGGGGAPEKQPQAESPLDGGQGDLAAQRMPGPTPEQPEPEQVSTVQTIA